MPVKTLAFAIATAMSLAVVELSEIQSESPSGQIGCPGDPHHSLVFPACAVGNPIPDAAFVLPVCHISSTAMRNTTRIPPTYAADVPLGNRMVWRGGVYCRRTCFAVYLRDFLPLLDIRHYLQISCFADQPRLLRIARSRRSRLLIDLTGNMPSHCAAPRAQPDCRQYPGWHCSG